MAPGNQVFAFVFAWKKKEGIYCLSKFSACLSIDGPKVVQDRSFGHKPVWQRRVLSLRLIIRCCALNLKHEPLISHKLIRAKFPLEKHKEAGVSSVSPLSSLSD